jgi:hypothetical protein
MKRLPLEYFIEKNNLTPIEPTIDLALATNSLEYTVIELETNENKISDYIREELKKTLKKDNITSIMTYEGLEEFAERVINRYQKLDVKKYFLTYEEFLANVKVANRLIYNNIIEVLYSFTELLEGELEEINDVTNKMLNELVNEGYKESDIEENNEADIESYEDYNPTINEEEAEKDFKIKSIKRLCKTLGNIDYLANEKLIETYNEYIKDFVSKKGEIFEKIKEDIKIILIIAIKKELPVNNIILELTKEKTQKSFIKLDELVSKINRKKIKVREYLS